MGFFQTKAGQNVISAVFSAIVDAIKRKVAKKSE